MFETVLELVSKYCLTLQWNEVFHSLIHVSWKHILKHLWLFAFWVFDEFFNNEKKQNRKSSRPDNYHTFLICGRNVPYIWETFCK